MIRLNRHRGFTLLEILLVVALFGMLASLAMPSMFGVLERRRFTESARQLKALIEMTRAQAMMTGLRHQIRWDDAQQQPIVEVEREPLDEPGTFDAVNASWATEPALIGDVNCHEVYFGRPLSLEIIDDRPEIFGDDAEGVLSDKGGLLGDDETARPALVFDPAGNVAWTTLVVARGAVGELEDDAERLWVVVDGRTGEASVEEPPEQDALADARIARSKLLKPVDEDEQLATSFFGDRRDAGVDRGMGDTGVGDTGVGGRGDGSAGGLDALKTMAEEAGGR